MEHRDSSTQLPLFEPSCVLLKLPEFLKASQFQADNARKARRNSRLELLQAMRAKTVLSLFVSC